MATKTDRARAAMGLGEQHDETPAGTAVSLLDRRIAETRTMELQFADAVAAGLNPQMLIRDAITALRNVPDLANTTKSSFFGALMTAAQLGLRPNVGSIGHGWVLPYRNNRTGKTEAQWILGYQGMVELAYRSGLVKAITAQTIFEGDNYDIDRGLDERLIHRPTSDKGRGAPIAHYAIVRLASGGNAWHLLWDWEVQEIMRGTAGFKSGKRTPWTTDYLPMARKTALRGLWRFTPKSPAMGLALATDEVTVLHESDGSTVIQEENETIVVTRAPESAPPAPAEPEQAQEAIQVPDEPMAPAERPAPSKVALALIGKIKATHGEETWHAAAELGTGAPPLADLSEYDVEELRQIAVINVEQTRQFLMPEELPAAGFKE